MRSTSLIVLPAVWWCIALVACTRVPSVSAFQPGLPNFSRVQHATTHHTPRRLDALPEIIGGADPAHIMPSVPTTAVLLASESESWRQYVPLAVSVGVIIDILLGSPIANMALGPMRRASEKGASGDPGQEGDAANGGGGSLFSTMGGDAGKRVIDKSKERVDSEAIAQAALDKAMGTLELKRFLEENKTDEQRYEEVRKKIDRQMDELE